MEFTTQAKKLGLVCALVVLAPMAAFGEEQKPCSGFRWPIQTEMSWITSEDSQPLDTASEIASPAAKAITLKMQPTKDAALPAKPGVKNQAIPPDSFSGWFKIASLPKGGIYQVTLSEHAWIDMVQNGAPLANAGFTGDPSCGVVRKSVRYRVGEGPVTVQISGAPNETIKVVVREAD